ncbi:hypothetical protein [Roseiconus lacunae]|uniref:Bacteriophage Mx8 p63 C-terminal domain-containing protein n=1 Tax=Roseiconus lacunae TaxID=2605694 RepID=A0ABT7PGY0_9BACT|nr:hypothetical protein [Roseiconus lacunae]MCD0458181.1 hypothetical protein [Roseiconus lacunae]MDM4015726.1 hypothetical protein [Roseiconus lacunae]WRQ52320.1 hypothetical protein U8335_07175 [Stieleria sp. HD01]
MLSRNEFVRQFTDRLKTDYRRHNAWFANFEDWTQEEILTTLINAAYKLYAATASNALELTLLGGTEIRTDSQLVRSFGVTAANGIQDEATRKIVRQEFLRRDAAAKQRYLLSRNRRVRATPVTKIGSILSEKKWSPILNDTLIIGAATFGQVFKLALTQNERADWEARHGKKVTRYAVLRSQFDIDECKQAWKEFFQMNTGMFFNDDDGNPRVFARELIGLCAFGYRPEFSWHQLGFYRQKTGKRITPTFRRYVDALAEVNFQERDRDAIMEKLGDFLFGDRKAIAFRTGMVRAGDLVS